MSENTLYERSIGPKFGSVTFDLVGLGDDMSQDAITYDCELNIDEIWEDYALPGEIKIGRTPYEGERHVIDTPSVRSHFGPNVRVAVAFCLTGENSMKFNPQVWDKGTATLREGHDGNLVLSASHPDAPLAKTELIIENNVVANVYVTRAER